MLAEAHITPLADTLVIVLLLDVSTKGIRIMLTIKLSSNEEDPERAFREAQYYANYHHLIVIFDYDGLIYNIYPVSPIHSSSSVAELVKQYHIDKEIAIQQEKDMEEWYASLAEETYDSTEESPPGCMW